MPTGLITALPELATPEQALQAGGRDALPLGTLVLRYRLANVEARVTPALAQPLAKGDLYVTESASQRGFALEYPDIGMHAISRREADDLPCIYCQVDCRFVDDKAAEQASEADDDDEQQQQQEEEEEEEEDLTEIHLIPDDFGTLDAVFEAISDCAALHPDRDFMEAEGDDEAFVDGQYFTGEMDPEELSEAGRAAMAYLDSIVDGPVPDHDEEDDEEVEGSANDDKKDEQFADAE
ncbi:regulator of volume decrease after cellular swelling-domain-containing protein [Thamnocephalis sphaerospora]|uniref:Regulator of volume decrease after cellular swelling-domain-containing protein n=1 Tax=Thamnocephalis sphaerospora TaxID=78915 RepID=A0A4P9XKK2_9FUNG|nr:regulator of volume decrease after cellular swelling-domain-containing protein [Thamnocephalis sphaerospora]|eukprot:RKP06286.1 regulator of volume decrease after cellular swelling-domain-containing protein [Thamnocephalis sphaerospora]